MSIDCWAVAEGAVATAVEDIAAGAATGIAGGASVVAAASLASFYRRLVERGSQSEPSRPR